MKKKERNCIAVIISKPERRYQEGLLRGVCKSAFDHDMNVAVFATTLLEKAGESQWGEQKIFDLIHYEKFAGIVYAVDTFYGHSATADLNKKLLKAQAQGIPVVAIDNEVEGIPCFYNDDTAAIESVMQHLISEHGVKDIAYMTGHKGHPHAESSLRAYLRVMERHNLPVLPGRTFYGDYWYNKAEEYIDLLTESSDGLPEAIVCANEYMAIGIYNVLYKRGIYAPKHICVGCTCNDSSTAPYLLADENSLEHVGFEACEFLLGSSTLPPSSDRSFHIPCKTHLLPSISCGCKRTSEFNFSENQGVTVDTDPGYYGEFNFFRESILSKDSYESLFREFDANLDFIAGFRGIYFCMCDGWDDPRFFIQDTHRNDYTENMQIFYSNENASGQPEMHLGQDRYFPVKEMFPKLFDPSGEPSVYLFRSLHFLDRIFGYVVLDNAQNTKAYDYVFNFWLRDVANALESQCRLQSVNYMYYTDIMTGLYNRNGFNTMLGTVLRDAVSNQHHVMVALADMNGLKHINDTYGHEEGDTAIKAAAALLKDQKIPCAIYEKNFRIGGDEFVKIAVGNFSHSVARKFKDSLYQSAEEFSKTSQKPYRTQMSVGICYKKIRKMEAIDNLLSVADKKMYEEKLRLKGARTD